MMGELEKAMAKQEALGWILESMEPDLPTLEWDESRQEWNDPRERWTRAYVKIVRTRQKGRQQE